MRSITTHRLNWVLSGVIAAAGMCLAVSAALAAREPPPDWVVAGLVALGVVAGYRLQVIYRIGSQRFILVWCQAAAAAALVLQSGPWMVLTTSAGMAAATFGPGGVRAVKAAYNTALYAVAATGAALTYQAIHPRQPLLSVWTGPAAVAAAMVVFSAVVETGIPAVIAAASGRPFGATFGDGALPRTMQAVTDLGLAVAAAVAAIAAPRLLILVATGGVVLHLGYRAAAAARTERLFGRRLITAIRLIGTGDPDRVSVARRAVEQTVGLVSADTVELLIHDSPSVLVRHTLSGRTWTGPACDAERLGDQVAEVTPVGEDGQTFGELRVYFTGYVRLGDRERSALTDLAAAVAGELRNAAAHNALTAMAEAAEHAASHDPATRLPGQQILLGWITDHLTHSRGSNADQPLALVCVNIKGFAEILAEFSIEAADHLLVHAAQRLACAVTGTERLAHIGGDTFAVLLPAIGDVEHARERVTHLLATLAAQPSPEPTPVVLTGVAGLVYAPPSTVLSAEHLLRQARAALRVGHRTRQAVTVYRAEDDTQGSSAIVLTSELRTAIRVGQLELAYELVVELATGKPLAVESLPRWSHPGRGMLYPPEWMPVLEQSDLAGRYVRWVLDQALQAQQQWNTTTRAPVPVVVRLPSQALFDPKLPAVIAAALAAADASPDRLTVQLAGSSVLAATDIVERVLVNLVKHGIRLAVGTAGLSLEQLCRVPTNEIRLPYRTTRLVTVDQEARARVKAVVAFADELGLRVTAEDVPTLDHINALLGLRVHAGQGPCVSPQLDATQIAQALQTAGQLTEPIHGARVITFPRQDRVD